MKLARRSTKLEKLSGRSSSANLSGIRDHQKSQKLSSFRAAACPKVTIGAVTISVKSRRSALSFGTI